MASQVYDEELRRNVLKGINAPGIAPGAEPPTGPLQSVPGAPSAPPVSQSYQIHGGRPADLNDPNDAWHAFQTTGQYAAPRNYDESVSLAGKFNEWGKGNGGWTANVNAGSGDKWDFSNGSVTDRGVDAVRNIGGAGSSLQYLSGLYPTGGHAQPGAAGAPGGAPAAGAPAAAAPAGGTFNDAVRQKILELMGRDPSAVSASDPALAPQVAAHRAATDRAARQQREALAEQANVGSGASSSTFGKGTQGILERAGQSNAGFEAGLVGDEIAARRQELQQALALGAGLLSDTERLAAQKELSELDAALRREQMTQQGSQFNSRLGFDMGVQESNMNALILQMLMGGGY